jgi:hypothetical protein
MNDRPAFQSFSAGRLVYQAPHLWRFLLINILLLKNPFMGFTYEPGIYPREKIQPFL